MSHVTARGFHGTTELAGRRILEDGFSVSQNDYDWLGDGIYFFQDAPQLALDWARQKSTAFPCVLEAHILIKDFIDLLDPKWSTWLANVHDRYVIELKAAKKLAPMQRGGAHRLDRAVLNYAVAVRTAEGYHVGGIRGAFVEGRPVFPNSALFTKSHIQIAVRDRSYISDVRILDTSEIESG